MSNSSRRSYKLDITTSTLTVSASFADAMNDPTSKEYQLVRQFKHDFPRLQIVRKTHKTPSRYHNKDGSITTRNKRNGLTYERMEHFIFAVSAKDDTDYLEAFYTVRDVAEVSCASPYAVVSEWFMRQFPKFRTNPLFYIDNKPAIVDFSTILERAKKKPSADKVEGEKEPA